MKKAKRPRLSKAEVKKRNRALLQREKEQEMEQQIERAMKEGENKVKPTKNPASTSSNTLLQHAEALGYPKEFQGEFLSAKIIAR